MIKKLGVYREQEITKDAWIECLRAIFNTDDGALFARTAEVRSPKDHLPGGICTGPTEEWHQDLNGEDYWIVVWANKWPTNLKTLDGRIVYGADPNNIWMFDNTKYYHRTPLQAKGTDRWFAKCTISKQDMEKWLMK